MTKYSICKASGESLGTFEADSAAGARDAWARSWGYERHDDMPRSSEDTGSLIVTAVGLSEAPAATASEFLSVEEAYAQSSYRHQLDIGNFKALCAKHGWRWKRETPETPAACPFNLPLAVGSAGGRVPDQIFDSRDQAVLILYAVDSKGSVDEARTMKWNQEGLARADYVVKAVNEHEGLVKLVEAQRQGLHQMTEHNLELARENRNQVERVRQLESAVNYLLDTSAPMTSQQKECWPVLQAAQRNHTKPDIETLIAKPVDRRKD